MNHKGAHAREATSRLRGSALACADVNHVLATETIPYKKLAPLPVIGPPRWPRKEKATIAKGYANPIGDVHVEFPSPTPIASRPA